jgi:hypothetical protein
VDEVTAVVEVEVVQHLQVLKEVLAVMALADV